MLEVKNMTKVFFEGTPDEKKVFDNFNLKVDSGEFVSIVGSNGSGKTTLLNIIAGDSEIKSGEIYIDDLKLNNLKNYKRAKRIARVFQNPEMGTCKTMTIFENMSIADNKLKPYNLSRGVNKKRYDFYRESLSVLGLGLEDRMNVETGVLSGGQRQALALVMATLVTPDLLLLDEHTAALDPKSGNAVMELTDKIVKERKITTLMVTHNLRYATDYGTRLIMLHEGKAVMDYKEEEKNNTSVDDILKTFNEISIECGN